MRKKSHKVPIRFISFLTLFVILCSYATISFLTKRGYFPMHDDTQVGRVVSMGKALVEGQFPVRWVGDLGYGYGYPLYNFYGPLPYYFGGALWALGISGITATKIMMGAGMLLAPVVMYGLVSTFAGAAAGVLAAVLYAYAPYHAVQLYVRGAVGELWAYAFIPLILLGILISRSGKASGKAVGIGTVGLVGIILSHTVFGYIAVVGYCTYIAGLLLSLVFKHDTHRKRHMLATVITLCFSLGISAFFILPAAAEMRFTNVAHQIGGGANFRDHFVCIGQLWNSLWGFGGSAAGCIDGMSYKLGKLHILTAATAIFFLWRRRKIFSPSVRQLAYLAGGVGAAGLFFMLPVSAPVWSRIPMSAFIQYPWRFLALTALGISVIGSIVLVRFRNKVIRLGIMLLLVWCIIAVNAKLFTGQYLYDRNPDDFETTEELRFRVSKISDEYLPPEIPVPDTVDGIVRDTIRQSVGFQTVRLYDQSARAAYQVTADITTDVTVWRTPFPGWVYSVDGTSVKARIIHGLPVITVPAGKHTITATFSDTPVRTVGNIISVLSLVILYVWSKHEKTKA